MNDFLQQFLVESRELAEQATEGLLTLEKSPQDPEQLDAVFRALHTLKGGAGIVDFFAMERALHGAEDLLSAARGGRRVLNPAMVGECLACLDQVLQWLDTIEQTGELPVACAGEADRIVARFGAALGGSAAEAATQPLDHSGKYEITALPANRPGMAAGQLSPRARTLLEAQVALVRESTSVASYGHLASAALTASNVLRSCGRNADADHLARFAAMTSTTDMLSSIQGSLARILGEDASDAHSPSVAAGSQPALPRPETTTRTLRVDAERIDALVRLTGELAVARNALAHLVKLAYTNGNPMEAALKARHAAFEHLIGELQRSVLALRVLPLRVVFRRFPRLLREMSDSLGKPVAVKIVGDDTEADKAIVEMLFEPLLHAVRNAMDHGVESAPVRATRGKPRAATIQMRAARQGDQVLIEISDDGGGMDVARIRLLAGERGVVPGEILGGMTDDEVIDLVFAAGFSTAAEVTALSGRGVGMDAVRTAVERVGGRVSIHSRAGQGTTVTFMLPFSVMMTKVMCVEAGGQMFGVPLDAVVETIRVPRGTLAAVGAARAVVVRDRTIPVFDLAQMLDETGKVHAADDAIIVIAAFAGQHCGLEVDALGERLDIILKPLDGLLAGTPGITGTTLLGDGRVLLVLDIGKLLQ